MWFGTIEEFEMWMNEAQGNCTTNKYPWETGGKRPSEYTWDEFQSLNDIEQEAFSMWFGTIEEFEMWMNEAQGNCTTNKYPWETGGKRPSEYTWEEFQSLNDIEQEAFFAWFDTVDDFETWMNSVN